LMKQRIWAFEFPGEMSGWVTWNGSVYTPTSRKKAQDAVELGGGIARL